MHRRLVALGPGLCLTGCVATGKRVEEGQLVQFEPGIKTFYEVVGKLGTPTSSIRAPDGTCQIAYVYTQAQINAWSFIPIPASFAQGSTSESSTVILNFDAQERLVNYSTQYGNTAVGMGLLNGQ